MRAHQNGHGYQPTSTAPLSVAAALGNQGLNLSVSSWSPSSSGRGSFEGAGRQPVAAVVRGEATANTFHLLTRLAEQLSDPQQLPSSSNMTVEQQASSMPAQAPAEGPAEQVAHQQPAQQNMLPGCLPSPAKHGSRQLPAHQATFTGQSTRGNGRKAKLQSPPGFSRPLDGAAKPFVPSTASWPQPGGSPALQQTVSAAAAGIDDISGPSKHVQEQMHATTGLARDNRGQQPANLATGQWALTNGSSTYHGHPHASSPFDPASRHRTASDADSSESWQVPVMQPQKSQNADSEPALPFLDCEHDKNSGLAPHMVLDFLGIGLSDDHERTSGVS